MKTVANPPPRLLDRVRREIRVRHYSRATERAYVDWVNKILLSRTTVRLPVWWPSFVAAVGCALLVVSLGVQVLRNIVKLMGLYRNGVESE